MFCAATLCGQQDVGSTAITEADHFPPTQEVQFLGHNGALTVSCSQAVTAVQPKHIHLSVERGHVIWICGKQCQPESVE